MSLTFDKTYEFNNEIEPKLKEIEDLCLKYKIPFFAVFGIKQNPTTELNKKVSSNVVMEKVLKSNVVEEKEVNAEQAYCLMPSLFTELETSDKTFGRLVNVMNGMQTVPVSESNAIPSIDIEDMSFDDTMPNKI